MIPTGRLMVRCPFCGEPWYTGLTFTGRLLKAAGRGSCHNGHSWDWSVADVYQEMVTDEADLPQGVKPV